MYVKAEINIVIPSGFYCEGCNHCKQDSYANGKNYHYCDIYGGMLDVSKDGRTIKDIECFQTIRKELKAK